LQNELKQLVDTISITEDQLTPLRREPIGKVNGLRAIESSLVLLYKALITIDPAFVDSSRAVDADSLNKITNSGFGNSELASMQALQEKKDRYLNEGAVFLDRLKKHMEITFGAAFLQTKESLERIDTTSMPSTKANIAAHDTGRDTLWMLSPVVLFAKEIDRASWDALVRMYQNQAGTAYQNEVRDNILSWKRFARKPTGDEQELLFTAQEKEPESITGAARKLTVKRSQTLARGLRAASGDKEVKANKTQDGKLFAFDVFARVLEDIGPVLLTEQNFVTEFFHATSTDSVDFPEAVARAHPEDRRGPDLWARKQYEADRAMAKRVAEVMEEIFSFWPTEIQNLVEWAVNADPLCVSCCRLTISLLITS
jgi:predicted transcriptional regulator